MVGPSPLPPLAGNQEMHINMKEMGAAFATASRWGHRWRGIAVVMVTDSTTVRAALNTGGSRSHEIMHYLRRLFWIASEYNFEFSSVFIGSRDNTICDALSRLNDPSSVGHLREADPAGRMCCRHILNNPIIFRSGQAAT